MTQSRMKSMLSNLVLALSVLGLSAASYAETRTFNAVAVEIDGTKFWLPSTFYVKKGDKVKFHLINKVPGAGSVHGFAIADYKVQEVVDTKGKDIEFTADKEGIFPINCQLHPAHIGGQLIVD